MERTSLGSVFSSHLLPSLGARINQATKLQKHIISPFSPRYRLWSLSWFVAGLPSTFTASLTFHVHHFRAWEMLLIILVIYSAWICPFEFGFLPYKQDALFIFDNIVNGFFAIDIVLTFFVAYLDTETYLLVDDAKKIAIRSVCSPWITPFISAADSNQFRTIIQFCEYNPRPLTGTYLPGLSSMSVRQRHLKLSASCSQIITVDSAIKHSTCSGSGDWDESAPCLQGSSPNSNLCLRLSSKFQIVMGEPQYSLCRFAFIQTREGHPVQLLLDSMHKTHFCKPFRTSFSLFPRDDTWVNLQLSH